MGSISVCGNPQDSTSMRYWSQDLMKTKFSIILKNYKGDFSFRIFFWLKNSESTQTVTTCWPYFKLKKNKKYDLPVQSVSSVIDRLFVYICEALPWLKWSSSGQSDSMMVMMQDDRHSRLQTLHHLGLMRQSWFLIDLSIECSSQGANCQTLVSRPFLRSICQLDCY